jgi:hypothetical protein
MLKSLSLIFVCLLFINNAFGNSNVLICPGLHINKNWFPDSIADKTNDQKIVANFELIESGDGQYKIRAVYVTADGTVLGERRVRAGILNRVASLYGETDQRSGRVSVDGYYQSNLLDLFSGMTALEITFKEGEELKLYGRSHNDRDYLATAAGVCQRL